jgi:branched-chain amino acid transport system permease protein
MQTLVLSLFNGITYGMLLFLLAAGLTLVFSMLGVLNFAHAGFYMLGAYFSYTFAQLLHLGFWAGLLAAPLCCALLGALVQRYALRRVMQGGLVAPLLLTFTLLLLMGEAVMLIWGRQPVDYAVPRALDVPLVTVMGVEFSAYRAFVLAMSLAVLAGLWALLHLTRIGVVVRASLSRPDIVNSLGHNLPTIQASVFVLGTALAGMGGALAGNIFGTEPGMADHLGSLLLIVIVVGGLGSLAGALWASLLVGVLQSLATATSWSWGDLLGPLAASLHQFDALGEPISRLAPLVPYMLIMAILVLRPRGLMGKRDL